MNRQPNVHGFPKEPVNQYMPDHSDLPPYEDQGVEVVNRPSFSRFSRSRLRHNVSKISSFTPRHGNSLLLPANELGDRRVASSFGDKKVCNFDWQIVDSDESSDGAYTICTGSDSDFEAVKSWLENNITFISNPEILDLISAALIEDNRAIQKLLDGKKDNNGEEEDVYGSFVSKLRTFLSQDGVKYIKKLVPQVSQLCAAHRGFHVNAMYQYGKPGKFGKINPFNGHEYRPLMNLMMFKQIVKVLQEATNRSALFECLMVPLIEHDSNYAFYQVMPRVDTEISVRQQKLPLDDAKTSRLVLNLCNAALLSNITGQADCSAANLCFVSDEDDDISDIRLFDCDVIDFGEQGDEREVFDCTNPKIFDPRVSIFHLVDGRGVCYDVRAALPPIMSEDLLDAVCAKLHVLERIAMDYSNNPEKGEPSAPFMLQRGGLIDQWKDRVMVLKPDGKLYKNRSSQECIDYNGSVALFILYKLHCSNDRCSLFMSLSFENLEQRYLESISPATEKVLSGFFKDFLMDEE